MRTPPASQEEEPNGLHTLGSVQVFHGQTTGIGHHEGGYKPDYRRQDRSRTKNALFGGRFCRTSVVLAGLCQLKRPKPLI